METITFLINGIAWFEVRWSGFVSNIPKINHPKWTALLFIFKYSIEEYSEGRTLDPPVWRSRGTGTPQEGERFLPVLDLRATLNALPHLTLSLAEDCILCTSSNAALLFNTTTSVAEALASHPAIWTYTVRLCQLLLTVETKGSPYTSSTLVSEVGGREDSIINTGPKPLLCDTTLMAVLSIDFSEFTLT